MPSRHETSGKGREDFSALYQEARRNWPGAAEKLVRRFRPAIRRQVEKKLARCLRSLVDDLVQDVWVQFFGKVIQDHDFDCAVKLEAYLIKMAVSLAINANRKFLQYQRHNVRHLQPLDGLVDRPDGGPADSQLGPDQNAELHESEAIRDYLCWLVENPSARAWLATVEEHLPWPDALPRELAGPKRLITEWTAEQVRILRASAGGATAELVAKQFGTTAQAVRAVRNRFRNFVESGASLLQTELCVDLFVVCGFGMRRMEPRLLPRLPWMIWRIRYRPPLDRLPLWPSESKGIWSSRRTPSCVLSARQFDEARESLEKAGALKWVDARSAVCGIGPRAWGEPESLDLCMERVIRIKTAAFAERLEEFVSASNYLVYLRRLEEVPHPRNSAPVRINGALVTPRNQGLGHYLPASPLRF